MEVKLSKICNDLTLLSSDPHCGFHEIRLPPVQAGSPTVPGKVTPVIPGGGQGWTYTMRICITLYKQQFKENLI
ncbi:lyase family protein [Marinovum sp. F03]|uniref:lyase family protein n=1 Tax=Marinovum sp. F03 TaxID=3449226 RepID=UPI003EDC9C18